MCVAICRQIPTLAIPHNLTTNPYHVHRNRTRYEVILYNFVNFTHYVLSTSQNEYTKYKLLRIQFRSTSMNKPSHAHSLRIRLAK